MIYQKNKLYIFNFFKLAEDQDNQKSANTEYSMQNISFVWKFSSNILCLYCQR